ncbi:MAG TPA: PEP/pyruvate-binding domain-containing protein [Actinomycetota bacterium]|nr:PEP/pyruvate-binding domain-containing protein [Actinomycetota bacterium]
MLIPLRAADGRCGAKAANLGRLLRAGFDVPAGFVIGGPGGDDGWVRELESALLDLGPGSFAVRSSAPAEDSRQASFAGQLDTTLGASTTAQVVEAVRRSAGSGAGPAVLGYAARTGQAAGAVVSVIVQVMVDPEAAGVLFTRHPLSGADQVVIEAAGGLGDKVVDGTVTPQAWTVDGGRVAGPGPAEAPVLSRAQVLALARTGRRIEAMFGLPQDVEWAVAGGKVWILQARPITTSPLEAAPVASGPGMVLVRGTPASPGVTLGPVRVITGLDDVDRFRAGDVLVCRTTSPAWTPLLARATAVVTEVGGMLAHAAIVAREFGIPAVVAAPGAMTTLADGQRVVVDGGAGTVTAATGETSSR